MQALTIFKDHVIYPDAPTDMRTELPLVEGLLLENFSKIVLRWGKYSPYLLRTQRMALKKWSDYDGIPLEDLYQIRFNADDYYTDSEDPYLLACFESIYDGDYDYTTMANRCRSTAYKIGRPTTPIETRFKIHKVFLRRKAGDTQEWFRGEALRLNLLLDSLDRITTDLSAWATSDVNMKVLCRTKTCSSRKNPTIISPSQLAAHARSEISVDAFREKLKCKACGARGAIISAD